MKRSRILGGLVFAAIAGFAVAVFGATEHPSETFKKYCA